MFENGDEEEVAFCNMLKKMLVMDYPPDSRATIEQLM
jgi:hypothetical protein